MSEMTIEKFEAFKHYFNTNHTIKIRNWNLIEKDHNWFEIYIGTDDYKIGDCFCIHKDVLNLNIFELIATPDSQILEAFAELDNENPETEEN